MRAVKKNKTKAPPAQSASFVAGCGRAQAGPGDLAELAYTALAFPECPPCPHRLLPEDGPSFCRWLRTSGEDHAHPFAALAPFRDALED